MFLRYNKEKGCDRMIEKHSTYALTINTPDSIITVTVQYKSVDKNDENMRTTVSVKI